MSCSLHVGEIDLFIAGDGGQGAIRRQRDALGDEVHRAVGKREVQAAAMTAAGARSALGAATAGRTDAGAGITTVTAGQ